MEIAGYRVDKPLASDSYSTHYLARRDDQEHLYVIRVLAEARAADEASRDAFLRGAKQAMNISHPGLLKVHQLGEFEGKPCYVMDYIGGGTLADKRHKLSLLEKVFAVRQVAITLAYVASFGLPHGNVHLGNIFLREQNGSAVLAGFGFEPSALREAADSTLEVGSAASYLSPEQWLGDIGAAANYLSPEHLLGEEITSRSDIYSLGAILYALLVDHPPHDALTILELKELFRGKFDAAAEKQLPAGKAIFADIISRSLARSPDARFESISDFGEALSRLAKNDIIAADKDTAVVNTVVVDAQSAVTAKSDMTEANGGVSPGNEEHKAASAEAAGAQATPATAGVVAVTKGGDDHSRDFDRMDKFIVGKGFQTKPATPDSFDSDTKPELKPGPPELSDTSATESSDSRVRNAVGKPAGGKAEFAAKTRNRGVAAGETPRSAAPAGSQSSARDSGGRRAVRPSRTAATAETGQARRQPRKQRNVPRPRATSHIDSENQRPDAGAEKVSVTRLHGSKPRAENYQANRAQPVSEQAQWRTGKSPWRPPLLVGLITLAVAATIYLLPADLQVQLFEKVILPLREALAGSG